MSYKSNWANGGWLTICDVCGRKFKEDRLRMRWDGLMTCEGDWEVRQPQDFVRGVADIQAPPYVRPEQQNSFLPFNFTQYPTEELPVEERLAKNFNKVVYNYSAASATLAGEALNVLALNALGTYFPDPERLLITEDYYFEWGKDFSESQPISETTTFVINKYFSEAIPLGETVYEDETEVTIESLAVVESLGKMFGKSTSESIAIAEVVSTTLTSGATSLVNASALNTSPMGS